MARWCACRRRCATASGPGCWRCSRRRRREMRRIAHLSDLHFGAEDPAVATALVADLAPSAPALALSSGALPQPAPRPEFAAARAWLDALPYPRLAVPGNHDLPLWPV